MALYPTASLYRRGLGYSRRSLPFGFGGLALLNFADIFVPPSFSYYEGCVRHAESRFSCSANEDGVILLLRHPLFPRHPRHHLLNRTALQPVFWVGTGF